MASAPNRPDPQRWQRHRAVRVVAGAARDATELVELLDMLGLTAADGTHPPGPAQEVQIPAPRHASPVERDLATTLLTDLTNAIR